MTGLREKKKSKRKGRIFSAAVDLFNEKGFSNTSMQDIADNANLAVGTLYNYFPSKNDLLLDIMHEEIEITIAENDALFNEVNLQNKSAKEIIKLISKKIFNFPLFVKKESLKEIFIATFSSNANMEKGVLLDIKLIEALQNLLNRLQKNNMINQNIDTSSASKIFYSILTVQMMMYIFHTEMDKEKLFKNTDEMIDLAFQGMKP